MEKTVQWMTSAVRHLPSKLKNGNAPKSARKKNRNLQNVHWGLKRAKHHSRVVFFFFFEDFKIHYNKRFKCFTNFSVDVCFVKFIWFVCSTEYTGSELGADCSEVSLTDPGAEDDQGYIQFLPKSDFSFGSALIGHVYQLHHYVSGRSSIQREQLRRRFHKAPPNIQKGPIWQKEKPKKNLSRKQQ